MSTEPRSLFVISLLPTALLLPYSPPPPPPPGFFGAGVELDVGASSNPPPPFSVGPTPPPLPLIMGMGGNGGTSSGLSGRTKRGVMSTSNSVCCPCLSLLLKILPIIGISLRNGIAALLFCARLLSKPAIANDWP